MRMDPTLKRPAAPARPWLTPARLLIAGIGMIVLAAVMGLLMLWEAVGGSRSMRMVELPGFHELSLTEPGSYIGLYQHRGNDPLPVAALSKLDVRVLSKDTYDEVPVMINSAGQTFRRFGFEGMPLFSFGIADPGDFTLSAFYTGETTGPAIPVMIFPQTAGNLKQTLIVGLLFVVLFLGGGILTIVKRKAWAS